MRHQQAHSCPKQLSERRVLDEDDKDEIAVRRARSLGEVTASVSVAWTAPPRDARMSPRQPRRDGHVGLGDHRIRRRKPTTANDRRVPRWVGAGRPTRDAASLELRVMTVTSACAFTRWSPRGSSPSRRDVPVMRRRVVSAGAAEWAFRPRPTTGGGGGARVRRGRRSLVCGVFGDVTGGGRETDDDDDDDVDGGGGEERSDAVERMSRARATLSRGANAVTRRVWDAIPRTGRTLAGSPSGGSGEDDTDDSPLAEGPDEKGKEDEPGPEPETGDTPAVSPASNAVIPPASQETRAPPRALAGYANGPPAKIEGRGRGRGKAKGAAQKRFMDDLSVKYPEQMEETRLKVRQDVRRSVLAARNLMLAQVFFVLAIVLLKQSLQHFSPAGFMASRAIVSVPFILALASPRADPKAHKELVTCGRELFTSGYFLFLGLLVFLGQALLYLGLQRVSVGNTVVLGQLVPVYSCTIAVFQGVEKPSVGKFVAIGAGVVGAVVMLDPAQMWLSQGNMFLLGRAAVFAAYLALQAPILQAFLPVTVSTAAQLFGAAFAVVLGIPFALHEGGFEAALGSLQGAPGEAWACVVGVAALSAAAYTLTAKAERNTTPVVAACYNTLQPVIALAVMTALGEAPGIRNLIGSVLVVLGGFAAVALSTNDRRLWRQVAADFTPDATQKANTPSPEGDVAEASTGGTVRRRRDDRLNAERSGTVQMVKVPGSIVGYGRGSRKRPKLGTVVWTVAWALGMSLCALAGGGFLTWSLVYLYWKYLC